MNSKTRMGVLLGVAALFTLAVFSFPPLAQDPDYHNFADHIRFLGIPNFADVISNLVFGVVGVMGLAALKRVAMHEQTFYRPQETIFFVLIFTGAFLTGLGSAYYHWAPGDATLLWDRLPMAIVFMAVFALILADRLGIELGLLALGPLVFLGLVSVLYWDHTETLGQGDLRPYILVQFLPILLLPVLLVLFPARYSKSICFVKLVGWYLVAKIFEQLDAWVFTGTAGMVSGHTLKHLVAGTALFFLVSYLEERRCLRPVGG
ncbi:hypothetical protein [Nitrospina watsonii]|uniref:Alkaline phytoceramidase n=1 Tax=Nitrospina watsonii TaxID=1323948 RepID=A0ABN8VXH1_9BACT|nr:hypothetical protein [Nitrospina watsonii]CAI2718447.1 conserved membrane protein of unknown function [Nitrospina watsonii]